MINNSVEGDMERALHCCPTSHTTWLQDNQAFYNRQ